MRSPVQEECVSSGSTPTLLHSKTIRHPPQTHLDVTSPPVQVQVHVLDIAVLGEPLLQILLARLFVHVRDQDNPALDGAHGGRAARRLGCVFAAGLFGVELHLGGGDVVNLHVGHGLRV